MSADVAAGVERLLAAELVAFATETVYGLGADAGSSEAVGKVYATKGRPADHPLLVHVSGLEAAERWVELDTAARALIEAFWPGPLTLIAKRRPEAPAHACGDESTVGLRCPAHPLAQALLSAFEAAGGLGIAAPSANRFGRISPTTAQHVRDDLGDDFFVLDGGPCDVGIESTIIDLSRGNPVLLRPGAITEAQVTSVLGPLRASAVPAPKAPGMLAAHYAPQTPLYLSAAIDFTDRLEELRLEGSVAVLSPRFAQKDAAWVRPPTAPDAYARGLYGWLRELDAVGADAILVEIPPDLPVWAGVHDRLGRASVGSGV